MACRKEQDKPLHFENSRLQKQQVMDQKAQLAPRGSVNNGSRAEQRQTNSLLVEIRCLFQGVRHQPPKISLTLHQQKEWSTGCFSGDDVMFAASKRELWVKEEK